MDVTARQRERSRRPRRRAEVALLVAIAGATFVALTMHPADAVAGEFTINTCQADRGNYSTRAFDDFATRGMSCFYDAVLLDVGHGVTGPLARFAIQRADQVVLLTDPEWIASVVLEALKHLPHQRTTLIVNRVDPGSLSDVRAVDERLKRTRRHRSVIIPADERLTVMLDSGTYSLEALDRPTRLPIKQLGLALAQRLA
jgi:MinD-like ATPase involved in chromosome partitioning or flagellar assembly